jgi:hypothetical protein
MEADTNIIPRRLPLLVTTSNRNSTVSKDARLVNCYIETDQANNNLDIYKRPGLKLKYNLASGPGMGMFNWKGDLYVMKSGSLFKNGISVPGGIGLDQTGGVYRFDSYLGANPKLVFGNGKKTYAYNATDGVSADLHSIDVDFPAETVKGFAYLNGFMFVMQPEAVIWNSAINSVTNPGDWNAIDFISAQGEPDNGVFLGKHLVYVIAFNQWSLEFFYNVDNPVASPLAPVQGSFANIGCKHQDSVQNIDGRLIWITVNRTEGIQVGLLESMGFQIKSTKAIDRLLTAWDFDIIYSWQAKLNGHTFYVITSPGSNMTLAYDLAEDLWHQWTDSNGNYLPIVSSAVDETGKTVVQHESNGDVYFLDVDIYADKDSVIPVDIYTPRFDAGTNRKKNLTMLELIADQVEGSEVLVRKSDDDYQTWSSFRTIKLGQIRKVLYNEGTFRRRAYHFRHQSNSPLRISAVDLQFDIGVL